MSGETSSSSSGRAANDGNAAYDAAKKDAEERPFRYAKYSEIQTKDVCGSTAGAGSGDFHEYRAIRRINLEREKKMERDYENAEREKAYMSTKQALEDEAADRTSKKAAKRRRKKARKKQAKLEHLQKQNKFSSDGSFREQFEKARKMTDDDPKDNDSEKPAHEKEELSESDIVKQKLLAAAAAADDVDAEIAAALLEDAAASEDEDSEPTAKKQKI